MPELPEVETVKERLKKKIIGKKIEDIIIRSSSIIKHPSEEHFVNKLRQQVVNDIKRRGKWLIIELNQYYLLVHLRMEGKFLFKTSEEIYNKHEHVIFNLNNKLQLRYHDTRKFGKMHLITKDELDKIKALNKLGLEPFDKKLNKEYLQEKLKHKKIPIKTALLDQSIIAGIGNIYVNEILFLSAINPIKPSNKVNINELGLIIKNTQQVLKKAIKLGGTTIRTYTSLDGETGLFQKELLVHGRKGEVCIKCDNIISKIKVGGRGTYYCPKCQPMKKLDILPKKL